MHRLIVTSHTYRQASATRADGRQLDPSNQLLWRMPLRRKDAEAIRDSLLAASRQLHYSMYGPGRGVTKRSDNQYVAAGKGLCRSVYVLHRRSTPLTMLATFDAPRMNTNCVQRQSSNVVSQALLLENGEMAERAAQRIARELLRLSGSSVQNAYQRILLRSPSQHERSLSETFLAEQTKRYALKTKQGKVDDKARLALADICLVLLNSAEFLYVD